MLNVNTIKVEQAALLAGMLENQISVGEAESIINQRPAGGFDKIEDFWALGSLTTIASKNDQLKSSFVVDSKFFKLEAKASDDALFRLESMLHIVGGNQLEVLTRQYGGQE